VLEIYVRESVAFGEAGSRGSKHHIASCAPLHSAASHIVNWAIKGTSADTVLPCIGLVVLYGVNALATRLIDSKIARFPSQSFRPPNRQLLLQNYRVYVSFAYHHPIYQPTNSGTTPETQRPKPRNQPIRGSWGMGPSQTTMKREQGGQRKYCT